MINLNNSLDTAPDRISETDYRNYISFKTRKLLLPYEQDETLTDKELFFLLYGMMRGIEITEAEHNNPYSNSHILKHTLNAIYNTLDTRANHYYQRSIDA